MPMAAASSFLPNNIISQPQNPNTFMSNYNNNHYLPDVDLFEYLGFIHQSEEDSSSSMSVFTTTTTTTPSQSPPPPISQQTTTNYTQTSLNSTHMDGLKRSSKNIDGRVRIAFRMKTELEIVDDGYKWRKYGKKMVKNSPNPRNYYKCSRGGCRVKKRVERDGENSSYVITTYEGVHNHAT